MMNHRQNSAIRAILAEDMEIDRRSEAFVVQITGNRQQGRTFMLEPGYNDTKIRRGVIAAKQLFVINEPRPVSVINVNFYSVKLKKSTFLKNCVDVPMVEYFLQFNIKPMHVKVGVMKNKI